jgi:rod shape-determining protein MreD
LPLLAFVAAVGLFEGRALLVWSALIGLCCDGLGSGPLGREIFSLCIVAFFVGRTHPRTNGCSPLRTLLTSFVIVSAALVISTSLEVALNRRSAAPFSLLQPIAGSAAYTALLAASIRACWNIVLRVCTSPLSVARPLRS